MEALSKGGGLCLLDLGGGALPQTHLPATDAGDNVPRLPDRERLVAELNLLAVELGRVL